MSRVLIFDNKSEAYQICSLNKIVKVQVENGTICLTRTNSGFFAFEKECPHMTDDLAKGKINNQNEIVCPWHAYRFNLKSGEESENRCADLKVYEISWVDEKLYVIL